MGEGVVKSMSKFTNSIILMYIHAYVVVSHREVFDKCIGDLPQQMLLESMVMTAPSSNQYGSKNSLARKICNTCCQHLSSVESIS
jgi:hypothetical protein